MHHSDRAVMDQNKGLSLFDNEREIAMAYIEAFTKRNGYLEAHNHLEYKLFDIGLRKETTHKAIGGQAFSMRDKKRKLYDQVRTHR